MNKKDIALRAAQVVLLYLVGGLIELYLILPSDGSGFGEYTFEIVFEALFLWPTLVTGEGIVVISALVLVSYLGWKGVETVADLFQEALDTAPSRRSLVALFVLVGVAGASVGLAVNPTEMYEHEYCQEPPKSAYIHFDALYQDPDGHYIYFAGGSHFWFYEVAENNPGDWYVQEYRGGYGRSGHAFEGTYVDDDETIYVIADEENLTFYRKNETAIGKQGGEKLLVADFVTNCYGEEDL